MNGIASEHRPRLAVVAFLAGLLLPVVVVLLIGAAVLFRPPWLGSLAVAFSGPEPHGYWFLSRTSGLAAFFLLWVSTLGGVAVSNRLARLWPGGPAAVDVHEFASLLGLGFVALHVLVLLGDRYIGYSLVQLLVPFTSLAYRPLEVALGQVGFYLVIPVTVAFYLRRQIGYRAFRVIHAASYAAFALALAHGLLAGTDSRNGAVLTFYLVAGGSVALLTVVRLLRRTPPRASASPAARPAVIPAVRARPEPRSLWLRRE
jgi:cytochrome b561